MEQDWDSVKRLICKEERMKDIAAIEAEYLEQHPDSGYLTEIMGLSAFPDYIEYLPKGAIVRKVKMMERPQKKTGKYPYIGMSREEYETYISRAVELVIEKIQNRRA